MALEDLRLRNTQQLLDDVDSHMPLLEDTVTLVVVDRPATRQQVLAVRRLDVPASQPDDHSLSRLLHDEMQALPIPRREPDRRTVVVTIIARRGFNVCTRTEATWMMAWLYSNHFTDAFVGDTVVVTDHGWASLDTHAAGSLPCLVRAA